VSEIVTQTAPPRLWLCVSDEPTDNASPFPKGLSDVTWAVDHCPVACGVGYIRSDLHNAELTRLRTALAAMTAERDRMKLACIKMDDEIGQTLGRALGYPWYKDDQVNFPGATEANGVCVGEHVAATIAMEAAAALAASQKTVKVLGNRVSLLDRMLVAYRVGKRPTDRLLNEMDDNNDAYAADPDARRAVEGTA